MKKNLLLFMFSFFFVGINQVQACDCDAPPNNLSINLTPTQVTFGANKSYSSNCSSYGLQVELKLVGQAFNGTTNLYSGTFIPSAGAIPLNPITVTLASIYATLGPGQVKWRVRQIHPTYVCNAWTESTQKFFSCTGTAAGPITAGGPLTFCQGGSVGLTSQAGTVYQWFRNNALISGATSQSYTATLSGSYSVTNTANGCPSPSVNVTAQVPPSTSASASATTIPFGGSSILTATFSSTMVYLIPLADILNMPYGCGNGSFYSFNNQGIRWTDIGTGNVTNVQIQFSVGVECHSGKTFTTVLNGSSGPGYVQTTYFCDCSIPLSERIVTLNIANPAVYNIGGLNSFNITNSTTEMGMVPAASLGNMYARVTVTYGLPAGTSFMWMPGSLTTNPVTVSPTETTTYTLSTTNGICSTEVPITINVLPPPVSFTLSSTNETCPGANNGTITVDVTGGSGGTIEYSLDNAAFVTTTVFSGLAPSNYQVRIKDGAYISTPQNIAVGSTLDTQPPAITCPANIVVSNTPNQCGATVTWSADPVIDQQQTSAGAATLGTTQWQSFTAGLSGQLTKVDLHTNGFSSGTQPYNFSIYQGQGAGGTLLYSGSGSFNTPFSDWFSLVIPSGSQPILTAGNQYTVQINITGSYSQLSNNNSNAYAGGIYFSNVYGAQSNWDLRFRTYVATNGATDNCGIPTVSYSPPSGSSFNVGTTTVTGTATDPSGNTTQCTFTVTVNDTQAPTISCPANKTLTAGPTCQATIPDYITSSNVNLSVTINSGSSATTCTDGFGGGAPEPQWRVNVANQGYVTYPQSGICFTNTPNTQYNQTYSCSNDYPSVISVCFRAFEDDGATCIVNESCLVDICQNFAVPAPGTTANYMLSIPNNGINASWGTVNFTLTSTGTFTNCPITATDNCSVATITQSPLPGTTLSAGNHNVTLTATDTAGNTGTCTFVVNVLDTTPPSITCPTNITGVVATSASGAVVNYTTPVGTDNCTGATTARTAGLASGATFPIGTTTVTHLVTDAAGLTAQCSFTVTVAGLTPQIVCPSNITTSNTLGQCSANVSFAATETTGIPASTISYSHASGSSFPVGITTVTATATNTVGSSSCTFTVTVNDTQAPSISCRPNITQNSDPGICGASVSFDLPPLAPTVDQSCTQSSIGTVGGDQWQSFTAGQNGLLTGIDLYHNGCQNTSFTMTIYTGTGTSGTVLYSGATNFGNFCSSWFNVAIPSGSQPTVTAGQTYTFRIQGTGTGFVAGNNSCYSSGSYYSSTYGLNPGWKLNFKTYVSVVSPSVSATDNCGVTSLTSNYQSGAVFPVGTTTVTYTATDTSGNTSNCSFTITVNDTQAPSISCPANITGVIATSASGAVVNYTTPIGTDNCSDATTTRTAGFASGATFPIGTTTVTHGVTDAAGLTAQCSFTVTVVGVNPVIACPANITINNTTGQCGANVSFAATETVGIPASTITYSSASGSSFPVGTTTVTATATNAVGSSSCTFTVTVNDTQAPVITCPGATTVSANNTGCTYSGSIGTATATDNCSVNVSGPVPAGPYPVGTTVVTWTATDASGNTATCTQSVVVVTSVPAVTANNVSGCFGTPIALSGSPAGGTWSIANPYTGASTTYTHSYTDGNGCSATSTSATVTTHKLDYANLQWPPNAAICPGGSFTTYGQVYEGGLTDVSPYITGQAPGIQAWVGISPVGSNSNPNTWSNWTPAVWNSGFVNNNDEYMATIGSSLAPGNYYYTFRYSYNGCAYQYGGYGGSGVWDGSSSVSGVLIVKALDYVNLQWPGSESICPGGSVTAYGQVFEGGLTDVGVNIPNQAPGIQAWIGISPVGNNSNPNTWSNWTLATWNNGHVSNNDEYMATFGSSLAPGTYYYTFRYSLDGCSYQYGGYNAGGSSFWNGVNYVSGVLTVNPLPTVTASDVSGCAGTAIALSGTPAGGSWSVANPYTGPSTTYTHTYTDGNGCTNTSAAANITVNPLPTPVITANGPTTFCNGGSVTLSATLSNNNTPYMNSYNAGGTPVDCKCPDGYVAVGYTGYTGSWMDKIQLACKKLNPNGTLDPAVVYTSALGIGGGGGPNGPYLLTGDKVLVGGRADDGCCGYLSRFEGYGQSVSYVQANGNNSSSATSAGVFGPAGSSLGTQFVPNGNVVVGIKGWLNGFVSGLSLIYAPINQVMTASYSWSNGSTASSITVAASGNYSVTATSAFGCSGTASQTVTVNQQPVAVSPTTVAICIGSSTTLQVSGASGYNWSPATGLNQTSGDTVTASPTVTTVYTITATDPGSCSATITVVVNPLPTPVINVTGSTTFCQGGSATLTVGSANPSIWNAGSLTFVKTFAGQTDNITPNTHLTRGNNAPLYNAITEAAAPMGNCYWTPGNTEWAYGNIADWNTLSYQYLWPMINCYPPSMVNQPMVVHLISENIYFQLTFTYWQAGGGNYTYTRTTQAAPYTDYSWSTSETTPSISVNTSGNYTVTVTDGNGCIATTSAATITVDPTSVGGTVTGGTSICPGLTSGLLTLSGNVGNVIYWESAIAPFVSWDPISNSSETYTSGALAETTQFRAVVQNGTCLLASSNPTTVVVYLTYPFYADNDNDGYGAGPIVILCSDAANHPPTGYVVDGTDCDDTKGDRHQTYPFYVDADGDSYGAAGSTAQQLCAVNATTPPLPNYSVNALDCNDAVAAIHPGVFDIPYDSIDNNCNGSLFDGHAPVVVHVLSPSCGGINHGINNTINCTEIYLGPGYLIGYRFKVTNLITGEVAYVNTIQHHFKLSDTDIYAYGTPYSIQVAAIVNGEVQPFNGPTCTLTTTSVATTKVIASQCGSTLLFMTSTINATAVNQAISYRFRVARADTPGVYYYSPERTSPNFNLTMLTVPDGFLSYATEYKVDVQIKIKLANFIAWSQFGQVCSIFTPPMPETSLVASQCEMTATSNTQVINTTPFAGATQYRFRLTLFDLLGNFVNSQYVDTPNPYFTLSMFTGLLSATTYTVSVSMKLYGSYVDYGKDCSVTTPLVAKMMVTSFKALAHPNPFAENFMIDVTTSSQEMVSLKVYDMMGRLVEQRELKVADLENSPIGDRYPSGVYNIIVTQGEELKAVRVVKR